MYLNQVAFRGGQWDWDTNSWEARDLAKYRLDRLGQKSLGQPNPKLWDNFVPFEFCPEGGSKFFIGKLQKLFRP